MEGRSGSDAAPRGTPRVRSRNPLVGCALLVGALGVLPVSGSAQTLDVVLDALEDSIRVHLYTEPDRALAHALDFRARAARGGDAHALARGENFVGLAHYIQGDATEAIEVYLRALASFEELGDAWFTAMVRNNIGAAYQLRRKPEEVLPWYEDALAGFRSLADTVWVANLLNNIGIQYLALERLEEAREYMEEALAVHAALGDEAAVHLLQGNLAATYLQLGDLDRAQGLAQAFLAHERVAADVGQLANVLTTTARIHIARGEGEEAVSAAETARTLARSRGLREREVNATAVLAEAQSMQGNHRLALETFRSFHALYDTLYSREKDERITELLTRYEVARRDSAIELLEAEKALAARTQWALALGLLLFLLVSIGTLLLWRARLRRVRALEEKNRVILGMLEEKEHLMREIHHRVKNNLQMVSSLLQLQSRHLSEPGAVAALAEGGSRVRSMAIIHHHLQTGESGGVVDVRGYVESLCATIAESYPRPDFDLTLTREVEDLALDVSVMVPLGLILNELLTNAMKHAFVGRSEGRILVQLHVEGEELVLRVFDDGVGIPGSIEAVDPGQGGFGTRMIRAFLPKLEGTLEVTVLDGTRVTVRARAWHPEIAARRPA